MGYDVFISHATEDKDDFVRPLANLLQKKGLSVWYDEFTLKIGDSIAQSINSGLANSSYGIVVISKHFISKQWTQRELGALFARENTDNKKILPIWHNITLDEIKQAYPLLADIFGVKSTEGMDLVVRRILEVVNPSLVSERAKSISRLVNLSPSIEDFNESKGGNYLVHSPEITLLAGGIVYSEKDKETKIIVLRGFDGDWLLPMGYKIGANETINMTALREIQEETGLLPDNLLAEHMLGSYADDSFANEHREVFIYVIRFIGNGYPELRSDPEHAEARWVSIADARRLIVNTNQNDLIKKFERTRIARD